MEVIKLSQLIVALRTPGHLTLRKRLIHGTAIHKQLQASVPEN